MENKCVENFSTSTLALLLIVPVLVNSRCTNPLISRKFLEKNRHIANFILTPYFFLASFIFTMLFFYFLSIFCLLTFVTFTLILSSIKVNVRFGWGENYEKIRVCCKSDLAFFCHSTIYGRGNSLKEISNWLI